MKLQQMHKYRMVCTNGMQKVSKGLIDIFKKYILPGVFNDGGSHVETSSICAVPLGII